MRSATAGSIAQALHRLADVVTSRRILASRIVAVAFFLLVLFTESTHGRGILHGLLASAGLLLVGIATVGRLWCSLYISGHKDARLVTVGPYSLCRNPLYLFSILGFTGLGLLTASITLAAGMLLVFVSTYHLVVRREEEYLGARHGATFEAYRAAVPRFLPKLSGLREPDTYVCHPRLFRRTLGDVVWFVWAAGGILLVQELHELRVLTPLVALP